MAVSDASKYVAEFVGTFLLVFTVGCNVLTGSGVWAATSIACVLMVSIYALGGISGANFNPAVSVTLGLTGKMDWATVGIYSVVQLVAGIMAGFCYYGLLGSTFNLAPTKGFGVMNAALAEILYTFMLCFVVLNVACSKAHAGKNQFYGLAIGFVIVAGGYSGGHISGGCFNPAVAFGIDVSSAKLGFGWCAAYTGFEIIGSCLAAALFMVCRPEDFRETEPEEDDKPNPLLAKLTSEFIGTYILVLTVGLNVLGGSPAAAFSIAASLMCMIFALGSCSGAHFNPAVTVAILCAGRDKCPVMDGCLYIVVQIIGGVCGAMTYMVMENGKTFGLGPQGSYKIAQACCAELVFTFVLCFVVLCVATTKAGLSEFFGLAIGMCVTVGGYAIGGVSGGSLNPAVSIAISTSHLKNNGGGVFMNCAIYSAVEIVAGAIAAGVFMVTQKAEYAKEEEEAKEE